MKVSQQSGDVSVGRRFTVEDGPVVEGDYRKSVFQTTGVYLQWKLDEGAWMLRTLQVSGGVLRKDGTPRTDFNGQTRRTWSYLDQAPAWLQHIALAMWPTGHPTYAVAVDRDFPEEP